MFECTMRSKPEIRTEYIHVYHFYEDQSLWHDCAPLKDSKSWKIKKYFFLQREESGPSKICLTMCKHDMQCQRNSTHALKWSCWREMFKKSPNLRSTTFKAIDLTSLKSHFAPRIREDRVITHFIQNRVNEELQKSPCLTSHGHVKGGLFKTSLKSCSTYAISSVSMPNYCSATSCISEKLTFPPHSKMDV